MPEEAGAHADTLLLGEPEEIWEQLLSDFEQGKLKPRYQRKEPLGLANLNPYPTNIITPDVCDYTWSVVVSRGCPNKCEFCLVHKFFPKYQLRPVADVVEEIRNLKYLGVEWV